MYLYPTQMQEADESVSACLGYRTLFAGLMILTYIGIADQIKRIQIKR